MSRMGERTRAAQAIQSAARVTSGWPKARPRAGDHRRHPAAAADEKVERNFPCPDRRPNDCFAVVAGCAESGPPATSTPRPETAPRVPASRRRCRAVLRNSGRGVMSGFGSAPARCGLSIDLPSNARSVSRRRNRREMRPADGDEASSDAPARLAIAARPGRFQINRRDLRVAAAGRRLPARRRRGRTRGCRRRKFPSDRKVARRCSRSPATS